MHNDRTPGPATVQTLGARGAKVLEAAAHAVGLGARAGEVSALFHELASSWAHRRPDERVPSVCTPDGSPLELSVPLGESELRFTVEPQSPPFGHRANWQAARRVLEGLRAQPAVSLSPIERALEKAAPASDDAGFGFAFVLAAGFGPVGPPGFKAYFNASIARANGAPWQALVEGSIPTSTVKAIEGAVGKASHVGILSYDLVPGPRARVKLYVGHGPRRPRTDPAQGVADLATIERVEALGASARSGDARTLLELFAPEALDPTSGVPVFVGSTIHLVGDGVDRVTTNVAFAPMGPGRPPRGDVLEARVASVARALGATHEPLAAFLAAVRGDAPLDPLTFVGVQREHSGARLTAYASPRFYD